MTYNLYMKFNEKLKLIRIEQGYTQKNVYTYLQVSPNCYASWEQGRTQPSIEMIIKLCNFFNITSDYLIGLTDEYGYKLTPAETYSFEYNHGKTKLVHYEQKKPTNK